MSRGSSGALGVLAASIAIAACAGAPPPVAATQAGGACRRVAPSCGGAAPPTFDADVAPILAKHCFKCHAPAGAGPDDYDSPPSREFLRTHGSVVGRELAACAMPPTGEPALPDAEALVVLRWATCSAPVTPTASGTPATSPTSSSAPR